MIGLICIVLYDVAICSMCKGKRKRTECKHYRSISLLSADRNICAWVVGTSGYSTQIDSGIN